MPHVQRVTTGPMTQNCYVVSDRGDAAVVDPGEDADAILSYLQEMSLRPQAILATHGHPDHIAGAIAIAEGFDVPFRIHPDDRFLLDKVNFYRVLLEKQAPIRVPEVDSFFTDGETLRFGAVEISVIHTPGHTPGSVCFETAGQLLTGDTIASGSIGAAFLPEADAGVLRESVERIAGRFDPATTLYPGHGEPFRLGDLRMLPKDDVSA